ncbi:MAG: hemolysin family protein [Alitiscatomonas sp.]
MDDGNSWIGILLFAASVAVFYLIYGFGAAIQALNTSALEDERDEGNKKAAARLRLQEDPGKYVRTNQGVTCFFTLDLGAFTLPQTAGYIRRFLAVKLAMAPGLAAGLALAAAFFVVAFFLVCLGVIIPKHVAAKSPIRFCYKALSVVEWAIKLLSPFTWLISVAAFVVLKAVGIDIRSSNEKVTEEDIMYMVNEGHDQGVLEASEAEMITNIFEFDDKVASDIMTHRKNVVALESTMTLKETVDFIVKEANNSRFPVYEEDIDNIVGVLHMRDVLYFAEQEEYLDRPISQIDGLLRSAHFAPEAKNINALFKEMQSEKIHMEIVIDEYGQTAGIVTLEDILEEIVGNIMDEYDNEEPDIVVKENGSFQLSGMTPLDDVEDALEMEFDEDDKDNFDTLNGFLISRLGHLPEDDEKGQVVFGGYRFSIVKAENKIIQTVMAERDAGPEHEKENEG